MGTSRGHGAARLAALRVLPPNRARSAQGTGASAQGATAEHSLFDALLAGFPDGLVLCDALLAPVHASASARWLLSDGGWAATPAAAACREAAAAALDRSGVASVSFTRDGAPWEARAAPLDSVQAPVCVAVRPAARSGPDAVLRRAHDLKAPLHAIRGFGALLLGGATGALKAEQRRALETIAAETERLRADLEGLVELVRSGGADTTDARASDGAGASHETEVPALDLAALVAETAARFQGSAAARGASLTCHATDVPGVSIPLADMRTVLENLLANALAVAPKGGKVRVRVRPGLAGTVACSVEDDGPGIPEAALEQIFEPYFRVAERGGAGGTGLGLAISRELIQRSGGTISAANRAAGGAVFTVMLPASSGAAIPRLYLAPVTSHSALARFQSALVAGLASTTAEGEWRIVGWEDGVLTVETKAAEPVQAAARACGLACWAVGA